MLRANDIRLVKMSATRPYFKMAFPRHPILCMSDTRKTAPQVESAWLAQVRTNAYRAIRTGQPSHDRATQGDRMGLKCQTTDTSAGPLLGTRFRVDAGRQQ